MPNSQFAHQNLRLPEVFYLHEVCHSCNNLFHSTVLHKQWVIHDVLLHRLMRKVSKRSRAVWETYPPGVWENGISRVHPHCTHGTYGVLHCLLFCTLEFLLWGTIVPLNFLAGYYCSIVASTPQPTVYASTLPYSCLMHTVHFVRPKENPKKQLYCPFLISGRVFFFFFFHIKIWWSD